MKDQLRILLIEDDSDDIELIQDALQENGVSYAVHAIKDGGEVTGFLAASPAEPDIIVMDLNLPKVHGKDILKQIKQTDGLKKVPVLILTTSSSQNDIDYCYKEGASRYMIKPTTTAGFRNVVAVIKELAG